MNPATGIAPTIVLLCSWAALFLPHPALGSDGIRSVTVYPDRALVVRDHAAAVAVGEGVIRIHPLPAQMDTTSLRVRAQGPDGLFLHHVETRTVQGRDLAHPGERRLAEALQAAQDDRRTLADSRQAHTLKMSFIERVAENAGAVEPTLPPDQWGRALTLIGEEATEALDQIARIDIRLRGVDAEIARIQRELDALRTDRRDSIEAYLHYRAGASGTARFTLEYLVPGASWSPLYEARLDTDTSRLEFLQRAEVRQNTGEEWRDVVLNLSTSQPALGGRLPELTPWFLDIAPPSRVMMRGEADTQAKSPAPAPMLEAALETTGFTSSYRVPGPVSLPPDNRGQHFQLASVELGAKISARVVPILSSNAYLVAETAFDGPIPWLPGPVTLFQDGQMVGRTQVGTLAPGTPLRLAFGVDDRLEIRHDLDRDSIGREGLLRRQRRLERGFRIHIDNRHAESLAVTVLDRIPVARDERIKVELSPTSTPPTERDVDGRLGVLSWTIDVAGGGTEELRFAYTVSWPEEIDEIHGLDGSRR